MKGIFRRLKRMDAFQWMGLVALACWAAMAAFGLVARPFRTFLVYTLCISPLVAYSVCLALYLLKGGDAK